MQKLCQQITNLFALWVVLLSVWAWFTPEWFTWVKPCITPGLGVIMLGMGLTLTLDDLQAVFRLPGRLVLGAASQFLIMPFLAWGVARALQLDNEIAVGLIITGCCPGGTASNVVTYLARANLPLSIAMTMTSTMLAVVLTPALTTLLASSRVEVDTWGMLQTMIIVVLLPVVSGATLNQFVLKQGRSGDLLRAVSPVVSVFVIALIVAYMIGANNAAIAQSPLEMIGTVIMFHMLGFLIGYGVGKAVGIDVLSRRTLSIEVGMQNSGLAIKLAKDHFSSMPLAPIPCAVSAITHCIIGSILATIWNKPAEPTAE